jgi:anaerobic selenocysteine-containing dehydrogenase
MSERVVRRSACPLDCPDLCGLEVTIEDDRVARVTGDRRGPITDGFICGKVRNIADHLYGDDRLRTPMMRASKRAPLQRASWDDALAAVAGRLAERRSCRTTTAARTAG